MEEEIRLIAGFMNLVIKPDKAPEGVLAFKIEDLNYHSNWNLLMPVVEKISLLPMVAETAVKSTGTRIWLKSNPGFIQGKQPHSLMINDCYIAVIEFIKWYNLNK